MGIFSRLSDIINANLNALLEKAEDPEKIIRLMIQEMEDTLVEIRSAAAKCIAEKKELRRRIARLERDETEWENKAELAISKNRDDLARAALAEKATTADQTETLRQELKLVESQLEKFNQDIAQLQSKLTDAKNRQRTLVMRHQSANSQLKARRHIHNEKLDEMMFRFESAERRIDQVESKGEAMSMGRKRTLSEEIQGLEDDERINADLEALKARMQGTKPNPESKKAESAKEASNG